MDTITLAIPRRTQHSASDAPLFNCVTLAAPPFPVEIDPQRRDTAPRSAPIRNPKRGILMGRSPRQRQFETGVMDMGGAL